MKRRRPILDSILRVYVVALLVAAIALNPLASSFVPIVILLWYIFQWRRKPTAMVGLLSEWFVFAAIALLLARAVGVLVSTLLALPVFLLISAKLGENAATVAAGSRPFEAGRRHLTGTALSLFLITAVLFVVALLVSSLSLAISSLVVLAALTGRTVAAWRGFATAPVAGSPITLRIVAGSTTSADLEFTNRTGIGGWLFLEVPGQWLQLSPVVLSMEGARLTTRVTLSPTLSGPTSVKLKARAIDRWGLVESTFELEPVHLYTIPRAEYAAWLVEQYMAGTGSGNLPLLANVGMIKPLHGWRRGVEYYGSRLYQPGDSLKSIDWKHSMGHRELIAKEFAEFGGRPAVILVDLVAGDAEEADRLAYAIISTALSLARESIPAALATYAQDQVKMTTESLGPEKLLSASLQTARQLIQVAKPSKYLAPPDVTRLRANIRRLGSVQGQAASVLTELLKVEYDTLKQTCLKSAASRALEQVLRKVDRESNIIVVSPPSGDKDALVFSEYSLRQRGNQVITLSV
jgi:hypothetical protein